MLSDMNGDICIHEECRADFIRVACVGNSGSCECGERGSTFMYDEHDEHGEFIPVVLNPNMFSELL